MTMVITLKIKINLCFFDSDGGITDVPNLLSILVGSNVIAYICSGRMA